MKRDTAFVCLRVGERLAAVVGLAALIARPGEVPVSIVVAFLGAPVLYLTVRRSRGGV